MTSSNNRVVIVLLCLQEEGVISIDLKGNIHKTRFGQAVYKHMMIKGMLS